MKLIPLLFAVVFAAPLAAQADRILLPLVVEGPVSGGYGSRWRTDLVVRNAGPHDVWIAVGCDDVCPPAILRPGQMVVDPAVSGLPRGAAYLFGPPERLEQLQVSLRVRDVSREDQSFGTELPVVRLDQMGEGTITFLDVPADAMFRRTLRLYSVSTEPVPVTIRVYDLAAPVEPIVETSATIEPADHRPFQYPAYTEILDFDALAKHPEAERLLVEVRTDSVRPIWGFVSVTNNVTQQVTIVTPR